MKRFGITAGLLVALAAVSACDRRAPVLFDGRTFRASVDALSEDRRGFAVQVRAAAGASDAARRAAAYEAVQYCLKRFGGTAITWADAPEASPDSLLTAEGALVRQGRCDFR